MLPPVKEVHLPHICLELFCLVNVAWYVQLSLLIQSRLFFTLEEALLWIMESYFSWQRLDGFVPVFCLQKTLTDGLEWCGLLVDYCDVFISCLGSHSDGTHSPQSIHCWASDECYISPNLMKKQTHLHLGWSEGEHIFIKCSFLGQLFL